MNNFDNDWENSLPLHMQVNDEGRDWSLAAQGEPMHPVMGQPQVEAMAPNVV